MSIDTAVLDGLRSIFGKKTTRNGLIQKEIEAARDLFEPVAGHKYDFFYYGKVDKSAQEWILHDWTSTGKNTEVTTTRYLVYPDGVFRAQDGQPYREISTDELQRLWQAVTKYYSRVRQLYS